MQHSYDFDLPNPDNLALITTAKAWARVPAPLSTPEKASLIKAIKQCLRDTDTALVAHYYVDGAIQDLALATGGTVADSLEMARFGKAHPAKRLLVAGVRFMGETAKILSPEKTILMPDLQANCSLDLGCPASALAQVKAAHPDRVLVVYANTSAEVKAMADWMVTSSCALPIVRHLHEQGKKILWAPDRHLGRYIQEQTGADMLLWNGACIVHDEFKSEELAALKLAHPQAMVLVHPESPAGVVALADVVGSTSALLKTATESNAREYIVATDQGLIHQMQLKSPDKVFIAAPTAGNSATCKSCAFCPWMAMNSLQGLLSSLQHGAGEVFVPQETTDLARQCIERMLAFTAQQPPPSNASNPWQQGLGPA